MIAVANGFTLQNVQNLDRHDLLDLIELLLELKSASWLDDEDSEERWNAAVKCWNNIVYS